MLSQQKVGYEEKMEELEQLHQQRKVCAFVCVCVCA